MARRTKKKKQPANVVGPLVQAVRYQLGLTQEELAARCQVDGLDISRGTLSQIEARLRRVTDAELFLLSLVLGVSTDRLFPEELLLRRRRKRPRGARRRSQKWRAR